MRKTIKTIVAVVMAAIFCVQPAVSVKETEHSGKNAVTSTVQEDTQIALKASDLGITAQDYSDNEQYAKMADSVAEMDIEKFKDACVSVIPMEELNILEDHSSESEVLGGGRNLVDNGTGTEQTAVSFVETPMYVYGIDVSKWQGAINWNLVKASGVSFAMIKCAGRSTGDGSLYIDSYFMQNIQEAQAAGIQVGVYFFSQAVNIYEAFEEACLTVNLLQQYNITYPVAFDWESSADYRVAAFPQNQLTMNMIAATFCNTVASYGYTPMVYACKNDLLYTYESASLSAAYKIWMANYYDDYYYTSRIYMFERPLPSTPFPYQMWQFGVSNVIAGIDGYVDMDLGFFYYMPTMASNFQLTVTNKTISTTYMQPVDLRAGIVARSSAGIDAVPFVVYSIVDAYGQLVTEDYAFGNVGIYTVNYSLTDADGTTASDTAMLYVYPPAGV